VDGRDRPGLDDPLQFPTVLFAQAGPRAWGLSRQQAVRSRGIEVQHPVAHRLQPDPADRRRGRARMAVVDRRQRQQPPHLAGIPG
jgi:hypothetical protein